MKLIDHIYQIIFRIKFSEVPKSFTSKDNLFKLKFDDNWVYSRKGNSFYTFHNLKDNLKGGLQFSFNWFVQPPDSMDDQQAVLHFIEKDENDKVDYKIVSFGNYHAIYYSKKYADSNIDFYYWYIYQNSLLTIVTYMISDQEPDYVKIDWLKRVSAIVTSLEVDLDRIQTNRMR